MNTLSGEDGHAVRLEAEVCNVDLDASGDAMTPIATTSNSNRPVRAIYYSLASANQEDLPYRPAPVREYQNARGYYAHGPLLELIEPGANGSPKSPISTGNLKDVIHLGWGRL